MGLMGSGAHSRASVWQQQQHEGFAAGLLWAEQDLVV